MSIESPLWPLGCAAQVASHLPTTGNEELSSDPTSVGSDRLGSE